MNLTDAKKLGKELIAKHCPKFRLTFNNRKRGLGYCNYLTTTISLSRDFVRLNDEDKVRDILLHEIAHAMSPLGEGHGRIFKSNAISIGCRNINANVIEKVVTPKGRFVYTCPNCGNQVSFYKRKRKKSACRECCNKYNGGRFTEKYILVGDYLPPRRARPLRFRG